VLLFEERCLDKERSFRNDHDALAEYRTSPVFTDAERAALDYATEVTNKKEVAPDTFARLARHYSERGICDIVWLVATEHLYNMSNIDLNIGSDGLCELRPPQGTRPSALGGRTDQLRRRPQPSLVSRCAQRRAPGSPLRTRAAWQDPQGMDRQH